MATGVADATIRYCDRLGVERAARWGEVAPDDLAAAMPVRVPPTYSGQRNYPGLFWSVRSRRHLVYESLLELAHLWLMDFRATTAAISTQPFQVLAAGSSHVPDLFVLDTKGGVEVVDIKPAAFRNYQRFRRQAELTEELCTILGWGYRVGCEPDPVVVRNVQMLAVGRRAVESDTGVDYRGIAARAAGCTLGRAMEWLRTDADDEGAFPLLAALLWRGLLEADLTQPLSAATHLEGGSW